NVGLPSSGVLSQTATKASVHTVAEAGTPSTISTTPGSVVVDRVLSAVATKTGADGSTLCATVTGATNGATSLQWQRFDGTSWVNITGATSATLSYCNFAADATPGPVSFSIGADNYTGKLYSVQLRLHAERNLHGNLCSTDSAPVTVKLVNAVDP
ncbi:MAG: hypothetical protein ACJ78Q_07900, partial [Chloroflexia bacterium]